MYCGSDTIQEETQSLTSTCDYLYPHEHINILNTICATTNNFLFLYRHRHKFSLRLVSQSVDLSRKELTVTTFALFAHFMNILRVGLKPKWTDTHNYFVFSLICFAVCLQSNTDGYKWACTFVNPCSSLTLHILFLFPSAGMFLILVWPHNDLLQHTSSSVTFSHTHDYVFAAI